MSPEWRDKRKIEKKGGKEEGRKEVRWAKDLVEYRDIQAQGKGRKVTRIGGKG